MPPILLDYQQKWVSDNSPVCICEKSRRIGISWADASRSALEAAADIANTFYISYNKDMTEQYIEDVAWWSQKYNLFASRIEKDIIHEPDKDILVYRVKFASGRKVVALSSKPASLRSIKGKIVIDEGAFVGDLAELMKAALAILVWGGQVRLISTHNGIDNYFNELVQGVRSGKFDYSLHKYDIEQALKSGLFQRICLVTGELWSLEKQDIWLKDLIKLYGIAYLEELYCMPTDVRGGGKMFKKEWFKIIARPPYQLYPVRFWDMAATPKELNENAYYTASVLMAKDYDDYFVFDARAKQLSPAESDEWMLETAIEDGYNVPVRGELEGGSAGLKVEYALKRYLAGFDYKSVKPLGDKVTRATPFANAAKNGNVHLIKGAWNDMYINALYPFDGTPKPLTNDLTDASSGAQSCLQLARIASIIGT